MSRVLVVLAALASAVLLGVAEGGAAPAQNPTLFGTVGPDFTISLVDAQGNRVTQVNPGTYTIEVDDRSDFHTFHLEGPGVDERTEVTFTGKVTWTVTFRDGVYVYHCDPHPELRGQFVAGNPPPPPPPPPPSPPPPSGGGAAKGKLVVTAGPGYTITLRTAAGRAVRTLRRGTYTVTVRDRSRAHNVHLIAPGFNKKTTLRYVGTQTWRVRLTRAGTLRYQCDPHARMGMRGAAKILR
jgi:plastocyanin